MDGARGAAADRRRRRQEHGRQGRVSADRGDRAPLREHARRALGRARRRARRPAARRPAPARPACSAGWRSSAAGASGSRRPRPPTARTSSWAPTSRSAGRSSAATGTSSRARSPVSADATHLTPEGAAAALRREHDRRRRHPRLDLRRHLRAGGRDRRRARRAAGRDAASTSRCTSTRASGGFVAPFIDPDLEWDFRVAARAVDQRLGPQVRARLPGRRLGRVARRRRAARGARLPRQLPRRRHADLRAELLAPGRPGRGAVLQLPAPRPRRATGASSRRAATRRAGWPQPSRGSGRSSWSPTARSCRCSPSACADEVERLHGLRRLRGGCARAAGSCPRTHAARTSRTSHVLRVVVRNGFGRDLAHSFADDLARVVARLEAGGGRVAPGDRTGFHH